MSHQATELWQGRGLSPSLIETIGMISPDELWWQNQMDSLTHHGNHRQVCTYQAPAIGLKLIPVSCAGLGQGPTG